MAAQGGVCLSSTDRWQLGTDSGTEPVCSTQEMFQYNIKTKARPTSGWMGAGGGEAQVQHIPPEARIFSSLLDSSHPSEKVPLLPVFYETPTHQPSNCSQHVLWFYVSNKKQLHLHKTCSFLSRLSPRGWSGMGGKLPFQQEPLLPCWHCQGTETQGNGHFPAVFLPAPAKMKPPQTRRHSPGWGTLQPHGTNAHTKISARPWQRASPRQFKPKSFMFMSDTHTGKATDCLKPAYGSAALFPHAFTEK